MELLTLLVEKSDYSLYNKAADRIEGDEIHWSDTDLKDLIKVSLHEHTLKKS